MSRKKLDLTIIVVSFRSRNKVTKLISKIKKNNKIIIVENSNDRFIKKKFSRDKGINIYFPNKNNGFGAGLNYGVYKAKTKYILIQNREFYKQRDLDRNETLVIAFPSTRVEKRLP